MKKKQEKKAILDVVCFLNISYNPRGTRENIKGYTILKIHTKFIPDILEYTGANITILNIALRLYGSDGFQNPLMKTILAMKYSSWIS
jgi:ABC-type transport system involved in Fe-S cluster assembly fused permease/ATPase subunit